MGGSIDLNVIGKEMERRREEDVIPPIKTKKSMGDNTPPCGTL